MAVQSGKTLKANIANTAHTVSVSSLRFKLLLFFLPSSAPHAKCPMHKTYNPRQFDRSLQRRIQVAD
jgi:hypothetical protein